jgi:hypothetical protein
LGFSEALLSQISPTGVNSMLRATVALLGQGFGSVLLESLKLLFILLVPFVAFAIVIHWFEYVSQRRLAERFGWKSVLWTGWLGTPIHELSHALMCRVFQHRIDEIALFEPDRESGRLGYVKHSFRTGNWFQEMGNLFIGIAPLLGGSIVLAVLLWVFYDDAATSAIETARADHSGDSFAKMFAIVSSLVGNILTISNLGTVRFWTFIYLVLCVGSHMAPSGSDYQGASRGVYLFGGIVLVGVFLLAFVGIDSVQMVDGMIATMGPLFAIFGLTIVLCGITTAIIWLITSFIPQRFRFVD